MTRLANRQLWFGLAVATAIVVGHGSPASAAGDDQYRSETEIRLMEMESRFRMVTGQYEEAMYRLTQMNRVLESSLADFDFRLRQLEHGGAPPPLPDQGRTADIPPASVPDPAPATNVVTPETRPEQYLIDGTPEEQFDAAFLLVRRNELGKAIEALRAFVMLYPDHLYRANAAYWLGRSYEAQGDYSQAASILVDAYNKHADSDKGAEILLHLGLTLGKLGQNEEACSAFEELKRRYASSSSAVKEGAIDGRKKAQCS